MEGEKKKTGFLQRRNGSVRLPGGHSDHRPALLSRRKSGCLLQRDTKTTACIHKQEINGQISSVLSTLYCILIQEQPFHYRWNRHRVFFTTGGQSYWFCKRKVNVWCRFPLCAMDCMQARGSICFLLIGVWRSSAHQDSPFYRLTHTHIHTLSLNKTEPCVYNSPAAGAAAIVCRLIVTWWNHVTDVPVRS